MSLKSEEEDLSTSARMSSTTMVSQALLTINVFIYRRKSGYS